MKEIAGRTVVATARIRDPDEVEMDDAEYPSERIEDAVGRPTDHPLTDDWDAEALVTDDQWEEFWLGMSETEDESLATGLFDEASETSEIQFARMVKASAATSSRKPPKGNTPSLESRCLRNHGLSVLTEPPSVRREGE